MARCPACKRHFRTLDDEEGMHECPRCGYAPWHDREPEEEPEPCPHNITEWQDGERLCLQCGDVL
jgi:hypothetical protein